MATGVEAAVRARRVPGRLLVRLAIVAAVVGAFWAWQPDDFRTIVHSPRALLKIGALVVRLEAIDVQNGPDYHVYLLSGTNRRNPSGGSELGKLKGNLGSQNYAVPAALDVSGPQTVLIWCRAFSTPVANATQSPV